MNARARGRQNKASELLKLKLQNVVNYLDTGATNQTQVQGKGSKYSKPFSDLSSTHFKPSDEKLMEVTYWTKNN